MSAAEPVDMSNAACLRRIAEHAREDRPRVFALYGIYNSEQFGFFCGWGMQWPADAGGAIFYDPEDGTTWRAESAESLRTVHEHIADVHLQWL